MAAFHSLRIDDATVLSSRLESNIRSKDNAYVPMFDGLKASKQRVPRGGVEEYYPARCSAQRLGPKLWFRRRLGPAARGSHEGLWHSNA